MKQYKTGPMVFGFLLLPAGLFGMDEAPLDQSGTLWAPFLEWSLKNPSCEGNPYDLVASATFTHRESGEIRTTPMFSAGENTWKFRFTGTRTGVWSLKTSSGDPDLDGKRGTITVRENPDPDVHGFLTSFGNKWGWQGTSRAFVPQLVMYRDPPGYYRKPELIDREIRLFFEEHGFNGFHTAVLCRWFDFEKVRSTEIESPDPNPDSRTFEALELLITKAHAAGGAVHIWAWGDEQRRMTPDKWGKNGKADRRLQRYIAARLGPLPGWTMGYGFDLDEWVRPAEIKEWRDHLQGLLGWHHFLGGRPAGPNRGTDHSEDVVWNRPLDYSSYEHHRPDYEVYVAALDATPDQPVFSEDRFRIRKSPYAGKDYDMERTRRGLWHSALAGGVANIWGHLHNSIDGGAASGPFPRPEWIKTNSVFFESRFLKDLIRDNRITDGVCLRSPGKGHFIFYKEDADSIEMDLSGMPGARPAVAVDARKAYREIPLGNLKGEKQTWSAPNRSDWAVAVGDFP